jgi:hypothetical protein
VPLRLDNLIESRYVELRRNLTVAAEVIVCVRVAWCEHPNLNHRSSSYLCVCVRTRLPTYEKLGSACGSRVVLPCGVQAV